MTYGAWVNPAPIPAALESVERALEACIAEHATAIGAGKEGKVQAGFEDPYGRWPGALVLQTERLARARRARAAGARQIERTLAMNLCWAAGQALDVLDPNDPLAAALRPHWRAYLEALAAGGPYSVLPRRRHEQLCAAALSEAGEPYYLHGALIMAQRLDALTELAPQAADSEPMRWLQKGIRQGKRFLTRALESYEQEGKLPDGMSARLCWSSTPLSLLEGTACALSIESKRNQSEQLTELARAHSRASGGLAPALPVIALPSLDWFEQIMPGDWLEPPNGGRVRGLCAQRQVVLLGPGLAQTSLAAAQRGQLDPSLMHELLHAVKTERSSEPFGDPELEWQEHAWYEGAQQAWAEEVCKLGSDPKTGLAGGRDRAGVHRGWRYALAALAQELERPQLDLAAELIKHGRHARLRRVAELLIGSDSEESCERVAAELGPAMRRAWIERRVRGHGPRCAQEIAAGLARLRSA